MLFTKKIAIKILSTVCISCIMISCTSPPYPVKIVNAKLIPKDLAAQFLNDNLSKKLIPWYSRSFIDIKHVNANELSISFDEHNQNMYNYEDLKLHYRRIDDCFQDSYLSIFIRTNEDLLHLKHISTNNKKTADKIIQSFISLGSTLGTDAQ